MTRDVWTVDEDACTIAYLAHLWTDAGVTLGVTADTDGRSRDCNVTCAKARDSLTNLACACHRQLLHAFSAKFFRPFPSPICTCLIAVEGRYHACHRDRVKAAVRMVLKVANFMKYTVVLQPESKCLFTKGV